MIGNSVVSKEAYDMIVVGGGNAALCAALSAHEHGARVLVLEAASKEDRGGNSRFAGSVFRATHHGLEDVKKVLSKEGLEDAERCTMSAYTPEMYREDLQETSHGRNDPVQTEMLIEKSWETIQWMQNKGVHWELTLRKYYNDAASTSVVDLFPMGPVKAVKEGVGLMKDLWEAVEKTDITVKYDCPAHDLLALGDTIFGIRTRQRESYVDIHGQVILACGGFEANPAMRRQYLGDGWDLVPVRGCKYNTGTMLQRSMDAGARPIGHWSAAHSSPQDISAPFKGDIEKTPIIPKYSYRYGISINVHGKRFFDEGEDHFTMTYAKTGKIIGDQPESRAYQIFDQKTLHLLEPRYRTASPIQADALVDLAKKLKIDPVTFEKTVRGFNEAVPEGQFHAYHKDGLRTKQWLSPQLIDAY